MSIWQQATLPGGSLRWAMGLWLNSRKLMSSAFVPSQKARRELLGGSPFWYTFNFALAANQTLESTEVCMVEFSLLDIRISGTNAAHASTVPGGSRVQIYDARRKQRFSISGINDGNIGGTAARPFFLRKPYKFHAGSKIQMRALDLTGAANTIQVVLFGVQHV